MLPPFQKLRMRRMALQREILSHQDSADQLRRQTRELNFRLRHLDERRVAFNEALDKHRLLLSSDIDASYREQMDAEDKDRQGLQERESNLQEKLNHHENCISSRLESVRRNQKQQLLEDQINNNRAQLTRDVEAVMLRHQRERTGD